MNRTRAGFTLIELLFIVTIIAVLAAIAVPNFLEAQTRSKLGRARADLAATAMALNRYYTDYGAYPPNHQEVRRYLDAALQNPIMDSTHTSAPADARIPWWETTDFSDSRTSFPGLDNGDYQIYNQSKIPPFDFNSRQLTLLTTPVSYLGTALSKTMFSYYSSYPRAYNYYGYFNIAEVFSGDAPTTTPGLWGDHLTSSTYFYVGSPGPAGDYQIWHPLSGPWISYDATNGTMSDGDLLIFEGRTPGGGHGPKEMHPDFADGPYYSMGML